VRGANGAARTGGPEGDPRIARATMEGEPAIASVWTLAFVWAAVIGNVSDPGTDCDAVWTGGASIATARVAGTGGASEVGADVVGATIWDAAGTACRRSIGFTAYLPSG
jgi:hypothetical protein